MIGNIVLLLFSGSALAAMVVDVFVKMFGN
jgi:hypothetical protein